jgi:DNA polymerase-3 subunit delta
MKIAPDGLAAELERRLVPLAVVMGDEPLLVDECLDLVRAAAERRGHTERDLLVADRYFDWDGLAAGLQNLSLFATGRYVQLRLPTGKPGDVGGRCLTALAAAPPPATTIALAVPAPDAATRRAAWFTAITAKAACVEVRTPSREQLPAWLRGRLGRAGLTADDDALEILANRIEGNLLAARQEIDLLSLLLPGGRVTAQAVREAVSDGARFDVDELAEAALAGDAGRAVRILGGLEREGVAPQLALWCLSRDVLALAEVLGGGPGRPVDQALQAAGVWRWRQELFRPALRGRSAAHAGPLLRVAARADQIIKGMRTGDPWRALLELTLALARAPLPAVETA